MQNRRLFIKTSLKTAPLLMFGTMVLDSCKKEYPPNGKKVVVIGSGIAGLSAASKLKEYGFEVTILESQNKIGGRISTYRNQNIIFDQGASWIHGSKGNPITKLAKKSGATTQKTIDDKSVVYNIDGLKYSDGFVTHQEKMFNEALEKISNAGQIGSSFKDIFENLYPEKTQDLFWKYMLSAYLEFDTASDISNLSSKHFYDDEEFGGSEELIINGYDRITDFLAKDINIVFNQKVEEVNWETPVVKVKTLTDDFFCDYVVCTIPLNILKSQVVTFTPDLPENKLSAMNGLEMGIVNKFLLTWNNAFWDNTQHFFGYTPLEKGKFNYFLNLKPFTGNNALVTFAYGEFAKISENLNDEDCKEEILNHLKAIHGNNVKNPTFFIRTKWGQNPDIKGSYTYVSKLGKSSDFDIMASSLENKVFFAGEHTSREYRGTVHGAYLSGTREADKIFKLI